MSLQKQRMDFVSNRAVPYVTALERIHPHYRAVIREARCCINIMKSEVEMV